MLTDEELIEIRNRAKLNDNRQIDPLPFARDVIAAMMAKAMDQEPIGYVDHSDCDVSGGERFIHIYADQDLKIGQYVFANPKPAQAAAIPKMPDKIKNATMTLESIGYAKGWNDCIDSILSASPKPDK